jgi:hypothetical protein
MQDELTRLESPLLEEIKRLEGTGLASQPLAVIIEHTHAAADVVAASLRSIDAIMVQPLHLVPAIRANLTPGQIRSVAGHPEVRRIVWDREQYVAV